MTDTMRLHRADPFPIPPAMGYNTWYTLSSTTQRECCNSPGLTRKMTRVLPSKNDDANVCTMTRTHDPMTAWTDTLTDDRQNDWERNTMIDCEHTTV
jgi:hypothetical protein